MTNTKLYPVIIKVKGFFEVKEMTLAELNNSLIDVEGVITRFEFIEQVTKDNYAKWLNFFNNETVEYLTLVEKNTIEEDNTKLLKALDKAKDRRLDLSCLRDKYFEIKETKLGPVKMMVKKKDVFKKVAKVHAKGKAALAELAAKENHSGSLQND